MIVNVHYIDEKTGTIRSSGTPLQCPERPRRNGGYRPHRQA